MNEQELKNLWQTDKSAPVIDFAKLQTSLDGWQAKLRRKTRIDIWSQGVTSALTVIPLYFYPRMIFAALGVFALGIWYIRELRELSEVNTGAAEALSVKQALEAKINRMKSYFRRTRFVMYALAVLICHAALYGLGFYDHLPNTPEWTPRLIKSLVLITILFEVSVFTATEIYFKILYTPALNDLKNLLRQLNSDQ